MSHRLITRRNALAAIAAGVTTAAPLDFAWGGGKIPVGMQLILAADTSASVTKGRYDIQMDGYLKAFQDGRLLRAIRNLEPPNLAVMFLTWSERQHVVMPWTLLHNKASVSEFCGRFAEQSMKRPYSGLYTRIDYLLESCITRFDQVYAGGRRVLDVSGDGGNSYQIKSRAGLKEAREMLVRSGVTINGLPILVVPPEYISPAQPPEGLDAYYRRHVIGGPGAFVVPSRGFEEFHNAILTKLVAEVA